MQTLLKYINSLALRMGDFIWKPSLELPQSWARRWAPGCVCWAVACSQSSAALCWLGMCLLQLHMFMRRDFMNSACQVIPPMHISIVKCNCASWMREIRFSFRTESKIISIFFSFPFLLKKPGNEANLSYAHIAYWHQRNKSVAFYWDDM